MPKRRTLWIFIYLALGIDHDKELYVGSRPVPLTDVGTKPIREILA